MTKLTHVGIAYDHENSRQFDFYITDDEILAQAKNIVKQAYKRSDDVPKGGD